MGLISPGGENLLDFLELRQVRSTYNGDHRDPLWWPQKGQSPCELLGGLSGYASRRCRGLSLCVESVSESEDSSPVLTWILGYFWSLPRGVSPRLEWGPAPVLSSRAVAAVSTGLRPCVASVPEPEESSPVLTWILGYFSGLPRGVSPRFELGHASALSSRAVAAVSRVPSRGSRDLCLSLEVFPKGCPTCHLGVCRCRSSA